jgi:uncharacterized membrane protein YgdD (TMEM256/DUF423 family)
MNVAPRWTGLAAGLLGFSGVALGAFGAHALKETLVARASLETWHTAVLYNLVHAVALVVVAKTGMANPSISLWIARFWISGIVLFSGSLYWLALGGPSVLGPITPLGGFAFLLGWSLVAWDAVKSSKA